MVCFVLIGGTAFFGYWILSQLNNALEDLSATSFAIAKISPIRLSNKTDNKEQITISAPETPEPEISETPKVIPNSTTPADLNLSLIIPNEVYIGCAYQLSFQSSTTISSLEATLVDAGAREIIEPNSSGLARENKIESNSQSLNWEVGMVWPGEYYIKVLNVNDVSLENRSKVFMISQMPKDISADEKERICKESGGSFY